MLANITTNLGYILLVILLVGFIFYAVASRTAARPELGSLLRRMGISARELMRKKGTPAVELGLMDPARTNDEIVDAMLAHPILINRPIVVTALGVKLCRPSEAVLDILPAPQHGEFRKEDGEIVVDRNRKPAEK